ncbi:MAG: UbiX family flavin prenyltransferase [Methanomicrobiales archaeon]|jgi:4-hydroxy-3-polyprenylbenzoate decarboxylase|nr:UbiX family flavin prenyltransferase [Methanomicrobiales archaeon]
MSEQTRRVVVGVSGASGSIYAKRLIEVLHEVYPPVEVHLIITDTAKAIAEHEHVIFPNFKENAVFRYAPDDLFAPVASGSFVHSGMVIIPCSMKTLSAVATGYASGLMTRAADVCLKERRPLVLVVRETPLSRVHMKNMLSAHDAGAVLLPASPPFYMNPDTILDLVDTIIARVLDILYINHDLNLRWTGVE